MKFTPDGGIVKIGVVDKEGIVGKNSRMYRHCSLMSLLVQNPVNACCNAKMTEPPVKIGTVFNNHVNEIWSVKTNYPNHPIDLYDYDISGAFPQLVQHPGIIKAQISIYRQLMITVTALHFGGNYGPASWEPISNTHCLMTEWIYDN